jgi:hypothetical protein
LLGLFLWISQKVNGKFGPCSPTYFPLIAQIGLVGIQEKMWHIPNTKYQLLALGSRYGCDSSILG